MVYSSAPSFEETDWREICLLYERLYGLQPSPVVALNAVVARSFADGPEVGLAALQAAGLEDSLAHYQPFHVAHADMLYRCGKPGAARAAYEAAMALSENDVERAYLTEQMAALEA